MNTIRRPFTARLLAAVALAVPFGFAQAESPTVAPEIDGFVSTLTRAEVRAATAADAAAGRIARHDADEQRLAFQPATSMLGRAQVAAEAAAARRLGLVAQGEQATPVATPEQAERIRLAGQRALLRTASR